MNTKDFPISDARLRLLLTPKQFQYYQQHFVHGRTMSDIAAEQGVTRAAVSKSLSDAKQRVLKYMEGVMNR